MPDRNRIPYRLLFSASEDVELESSLLPAGGLILVQKDDPIGKYHVMQKDETAP